MAPPRITTLPYRGTRPKLTTLPGRKGDTPKATPLKVGGGLAAKIDSYLEGRGSPMAGLGQKFVAAGQMYGVDPRLLVGIGVIESGAGKFEKHPNNFANWGVHRGVTYESREDAIAALAKGMRDGYISQGLRTPRQIVSKYAPASDNNDEGNWASVVGDVMGKIGGAVPRDLTGRGGKGFAPGPTLGTPRTPEVRFGQTTPDSKSFLREGLLQSLMGGERLTSSGFLGLIRDSRTQAEQARAAASAVPRPRPGPGGVTQNVTQTPGGPTPAPLKAGAKGIVTSHGWAETPHAGGHTGGLPEFTQPADIMGAPGTPIHAPSGGVITRIGTAQEGGQSYYLTGDDGYEYWLGHIDARLPVGSRVKADQVIATVSGEHPRPHLHIDRRKL